MGKRYRKACGHCLDMINAKNEIERLKKENEKLKTENTSLIAEQNVSMLLLDLILSAVKLWGQQHGLIANEEDPADEFIARHNKTEQFLNQSKGMEIKELENRIIEVLNAFDGID